HLSRTTVATEHDGWFAGAYDWRKVMFRPLVRVLSIGLLLVGSSALAATPVGKPGAEPARLDTFLSSDGNGYFALSLSPTMPLKEANAHDIVVLFDTSASQVGDFREKALTTLKSMLSLLNEPDRVKLFALDLEA